MQGIGVAMSASSSVDEEIVTTSGWTVSGLLVTGGTNSLNTLVLAVSVASAALSRKWAG